MEDGRDKKFPVQRKFKDPKDKPFVYSNNAFSRSKSKVYKEAFEFLIKFVQDEDKLTHEKDNEPTTWFNLTVCQNYRVFVLKPLGLILNQM